MRSPLFVVTALAALSVSLLVTSGAQAKRPPGLEPEGAKWTYMVYCDGDNDLETYVMRDMVDEFSRQGSNADVNVVVLADRAPGYDTSAGDWTGTKLFSVTRGMTAAPENAIADWGERDMGDPQTLINFVAWCKASKPARRYALILWDHGGMWRPDQTMVDESSGGDGLDQDEIIAAMTAVGPVDAVGYDACQSATIEVAATWRPFAQAMAASEETIGYTGIQHDTVIAALRADPAMTGRQLAVEIAKSDAADPCFSAIVLDADFDALVMAVDQWSLALNSGLPANRPAYVAADRVAQNYYTPCNVDLYDMAREIKAEVGDPAIQTACRNVMDALGNVVRYNFRHGRRYADSYGLTIFWPQTAQDLVSYDWPYYSSLRFAQQTRWDEFLAAYAQ